jgi:hypothetical protein
MFDLGRWRELAFQKPSHTDLPILTGHIRALRPQANGRLLVEPEFRHEVLPLASLKGLDIPSRRAVFVPWKPSRRRGFGMGNPAFS